MHNEMMNTLDDQMNISNDNANEEAIRFIIDFPIIDT